MIFVLFDKVRGGVTDSNDIITMYPFDNSERVDFMDISPALNDGMKLDKARRQSQIDKFYQRYGNVGKK